MLGLFMSYAGPPTVSATLSTVVTVVKIVVTHDYQLSNYQLRNQVSVYHRNKLSNMFCFSPFDLELSCVSKLFTTILIRWV